MPNRFADAAAQNAHTSESIVVKIDNMSPSGAVKKSVLLANNGVQESTAGARLNSKKNMKRKEAKRSVGSGRLSNDRLQASNETKKNVEKLDEKKIRIETRTHNRQGRDPLGMVVITTSANVEERVAVDEQVEVGVQAFQRLSSRVNKIWLVSRTTKKSGRMSTRILKRVPNRSIVSSKNTRFNLISASLAKTASNR